MCVSGDVKKYIKKKTKKVYGTPLIVSSCVFVVMLQKKYSQKKGGGLELERQAHTKTTRPEHCSVRVRCVCVCVRARARSCPRLGVRDCDVG